MYQYSTKVAKSSLCEFTVHFNPNYSQNQPENCYNTIKSHYSRKYLSFRFTEQSIHENLYPSSGESTQCTLRGRADREKGALL